MKYLFFFILLFASCTTNTDLSFVSQEVIEGKISAVKKGINYADDVVLPKIWVQSPTQTKEIEIPFEYENRWKVGDSCLLIIQKYKENKENK